MLLQARSSLLFLENLKLTGKVSAAVPGWYGGCEGKKGVVVGDVRVGRQSPRGALNSVVLSVLL